MNTITLNRTIDFSALECRISNIANLQTPTLAERENLWTVAVQTHHAALQAGLRTAQVKKDLSVWLCARVPALGQSQVAIFRQLYRKIDRLAAAGNLADNRREDAKKRRAPVLSETDRAALVNEAVEVCGGLVDFAWQSCLRRKTLSAEILKRYPAPTNRRPRCPQRIRRQVAAEIAAVYQHRVRPHSNSNNVAPMTRDWRNVYAQDAYEIDDKTLDVLCRVTEEENGGPVEREIRCQFLPLIDVKSGKILDFVLIGEANYTSVSIRTLITRTCKKYGLPERFSFERGMFKNAKLLGNNARNRSFAEVENFATRIGIAIHHALPGRARTKIVETVFRLLDRKMYAWPGYIGNDEMHNKFERARDGGLWTYEELFAHLVKAVEDYNNTPSESRVKDGYLTPNEVWQNCRRRNEKNEIVPVVKLPPEMEYLLAEHRAEVTVREYGVKTNIGSETFQFYSEELVHLARGFSGEKVALWFDPGNPDTAVVTDLKEERFLPVTRVPNAPAHATTPEEWQQFANASAPYRNHMRQLRQRQSDLKATFVPPFRATITDATAKVKAQARSEAKAKADKQSVARQARPNETNEDYATRKAALDAALEVLRQDQAHMFL